MAWRKAPDAAREVERAAQLLNEARELQSRYAVLRAIDELIQGSRRRLALSRALLAKPVCSPHRAPSAALDQPPDGEAERDSVELPSERS